MPAPDSRSSHPSVAPERRTSRDIAISVLLLIIVLIAGTALWVTGQAHTSHLEVIGEATRAPAIIREPTGLTEVWSAPSPLTAHPQQRGALIAGTTVVTGTAQEVVGRNPINGEPAWRYHRDRTLCGLESAWGNAITVWKYGNGCGEVISIQGASGKYGATRSWHADESRRILTGGNHVLSIGPHNVEVWRSDMVRTLIVGPHQTPLQPAHRNRTVCHIIDAEENESRLGIIERCPSDKGARLSIHKAVPKDDVDPQKLGTLYLNSPTADIIEASEKHFLIYIESPTPELLTVSPEGTVVERRDVEKAQQLYRPILRTDKSVFWFDGARLYAFSRDDLSLRWVMDGAVGTPGVLSSLQNSPNWLLVPVAEGLGLVNGATGEQVRTLRVTGPKISRVVAFGGMIMVQQGLKVKGLRPLFDD